MWKEWVDAYNGLKSNKDGGGDICTNLLANIICPTLIVHGDKDPIVSDEHPDFLEKNIINSRYFLNWPIPASFCLFLSFSHYNFKNTN